LKRARNARSTGGAALPAVALDELVDLAHHHLLDVAAAGEGLGHARGVNVELDRRRLAGQHVALEIRRNIQHEGVVAASMPASMPDSGIIAGGLKRGG
jgi:hypothetical protein